MSVPDGLVWTEALAASVGSALIVEAALGATASLTPAPDGKIGLAATPDRKRGVGMAEGSEPRQRATDVRPERASSAASPPERAVPERTKESTVFQATWLEPAVKRRTDSHCSLEAAVLLAVCRESLALAEDLDEVAFPFALCAVRRTRAWGLPRRERTCPLQQTRRRSSSRASEPRAQRRFLPQTS